MLGVGGVGEICFKELTDEIAEVQGKLKFEIKAVWSRIPPSSRARNPFL